MSLSARRSWTDRITKPSTIFVIIALMYIATSEYGGLMSKDTVSTAMASWALAVHHTVNLRFIHSVQSGTSGLWIVRGAHGTLVTNRFPGGILLAVPLYAIRGGAFSAQPAAISTALAAAGVCAVLYKVFLQFQTRKVSLLATAIFAFGTSNWSVASRELWEHSGSELLIALGMLALLKRRWGWAGLALGLTVLFRAHLGLAVMAIAIGIALVERRLRPSVVFGAAAVPGLVAYLAWNRIVFGHITLMGGYSSNHIAGSGVGLVGFLDNIAGTLVSPERGILVCTPILILCLIGMRKAWQTVTPMVRVFCVAGLVYLASQLWLIRYSGGDGFYGYRTCLETLVYCSPFLVQAGLIGIRRVPAAFTWLLAALSVTYFASAMFISAEFLGVWNPWTTWTPLQLIQQYGSGEVWLGRLVGLAGVFVAWAVLRELKRDDKSAEAPLLPQSSEPRIGITAPNSRVALFTGRRRPLSRDGTGIVHAG
jgi:alpha-1,2-mannosyltransferase